jgi:hypothetical protein
MMYGIKIHTREGILKLAVLSAIGRIVTMDESISEGCVTVVPEEVARTLEQNSPLLMTEVSREGLRERLLSHISDYALLRELAPKWISVEAYLDSKRRIFFQDLLHALDAEDWQTCHPDFYALFMSIAPEIEDRIDDAFGIPW